MKTKKLFNKEDYKRGKAYLCMSILGWCSGAVTFSLYSMGSFVEVDMTELLVVGVIGTAVISFIAGMCDGNGDITG